MPRIDREQVRKTAVLARLKLDESQVDMFSEQLSRLLEYVEILNEVETENVEPMAHAVELTNVFRPDEPQPSIPRDEALSNAPRTDGRCFLVPAILDGGS